MIFEVLTDKNRALQTQIYRKFSKPNFKIINVHLIYISQEFAETAMNELLGWYGYGNVDRSDTKIPTSVQQVHLLDQSSSNTTKSPVSRISSIARGTSSTPDRNSSSENSKSPILRQIINKQGVCVYRYRNTVLISSFNHRVFFPALFICNK